MKQYILTCINEEKEVVSTQAFTTLGEAQEQMTKELDSHLHEFEANDDYIESHSLGKHCAHIYYSDNLEYHWEISNIDVPDSIVVQLMNKMMNTMIDVKQTPEQMEEIFGEGAGYMAARLRPLHTFYNTLDTENRMKFVKYLLDN